MPFRDLDLRAVQVKESLQRQTYAYIVKDVSSAKMVKPIKPVEITATLRCKVAVVGEKLL